MKIILHDSEVDCNGHNDGVGDHGCDDYNNANQEMALEALAFDFNFGCDNFR